MREGEQLFPQKFLEEKEARMLSYMIFYITVMLEFKRLILVKKKRKHNYKIFITLLFKRFPLPVLLTSASWNYWELFSPHSLFSLPFESVSKSLPSVTHISLLGGINAQLLWSPLALCIGGFGSTCAFTELSGVFTWFQA